ncbi:unnamed protein product [Cuscuta campestris]|uniref:P-type Ca(2+) transporter n=1 Tax=Cuscuta campestris TaxID=132261 RepID=A0A484LLV9_9ASTE|nr:unnamed protein product [Cuscuta campestris]
MEKVSLILFEGSKYPIFFSSSKPDEREWAGAIFCFGQANYVNFAIKEQKGEEGTSLGGHGLGTEPDDHRQRRGGPKALSALEIALLEIHHFLKHRSKHMDFRKKYILLPCKVRMVTGDSIQTAKAIALECGILESNSDASEPNVIEGKVFRALSESVRQEISEKISVMGRSSPNDKLLLVQALRKNGHVVAVTGDGTNDAPALHEADIGLAMGIQGTEVAKESSDIIILDDNFASVVKVVRWGRSVYANIQKFIQFQLTVNVAALIINVVAAVSVGDVPLTAVQLLWVNLIMDTLGALALATEPPTDHLMERHPVGRREPLITNIMWRNLVIQALYQVTVLLVLNFRGKGILKLEDANRDQADKVKNTVIFNSFVLCQIFNEFNARKPDEINVFKGVHRNRLFVFIVSLTLVLQVIIIMFLGKFTSTVRLSWKLWLVSVAIGFISWPLAALGKMIPVPDMPFSETFGRKRCTRR